MTKYKVVLEGIKENISAVGLNIPHFEKVKPEHSNPDDVKTVLEDLLAIKEVLCNPSSNNEIMQMGVVDRSILDLQTLPECEE